MHNLGSIADMKTRLKIRSDCEKQQELKLRARKNLFKHGKALRGKHVQKLLDKHSLVLATVS